MILLREGQGVIGARGRVDMNKEGSFGAYRFHNRVIWLEKRMFRVSTLRGRI